MNVKQSVVVRKDLLMSPGLLAAQVAHMNDQWLRDRVLASKDNRNSMQGESKIVNFDSAEFQWLEGPVLTILAVNIPEELDVLVKKAKDIGVAFRIWKDTIPSQIFGSDDRPVFLEVVVGVAFGPCDDEKLKQVTGGLKLYS